MEEKIQLLTKEATCDLENIKSEKEVSDFWQKYF